MTAAPAAPPAPPTGPVGGGIPVSANERPPEFVREAASTRQQGLDRIESQKKGFLSELDNAAKLSTPEQKEAPKVEKATEKPKIDQKVEKPEAKVEKPKVEKPKPKDALERLQQQAEEEEESTEIDGGETKVEEKPAAEQSPEEKKQYKWGELKKKADSYDSEKPQWETRVKELETKLADYEKANRINDYENLSKEHAETKKKLAEYDVQHSDEYKENVKVPYEQRMGRLKEYAEAYEMDFAKLSEASDMTSEAKRDSALEAILGDAGKTPGHATIAKLSFLLSEISEINGFRDQMMQNAEQAKEHIQLQRERVEHETSTKKQAELKQVGEDIFLKLQKSIPMLKDEGVAKEIKEAFTTSELPAPMKAYSIYAAEILPRVQEWAKSQLAERDKEIASLKATIAKRAGSNPSVETNGSRQDNGTPSDAHLSLSERLEIAARRSGGM